MATFAKIKMVSEDVTAYDVTGKYKANGAYAAVEDGALVVLGNLDASTVYTGNKDMNVFEIKAPTADTDKIAIVDIADVSKGDVRGEAWRVGIRTDGLVAEPGQPVRVRIPDTGKGIDRFWVSEDAFVSTPTVGEYAIATANSTKYTPSATDVSAQKFCVKIEMAKDFVLGQTVAGKMYYCRVL